MRADFRVFRGFPRKDARLFLSAALAGVLGIGTATAQGAPDPAKPAVSNQPDTHVFNYGDRDSTCLRWTDACRTCDKRGQENLICSNIGIACQPAEIRCLERREGEEKKKK
jgi:hypothetical protein